MTTSFGHHKAISQTLKKAGTYRLVKWPDGGRN